MSFPFFYTMNIFTTTLEKLSIKTKNIVKTDEQLIAEIHEDFNTEVDRLLEEASIKKSAQDEENILGKAERLSKLGFNKTKINSKAQEFSKKAGEIEEEVKSNNKLIEAIVYFTNKYPQYKFITKDSVLRLCKKYNLILGGVGEYIGGVPEKNLQDIEAFKVNEEDEAYQVDYGFGDNYFYSQEESKRRIKYRMSHIPRLCPFSIVAPQKDFDIRQDQKVSNFQIVPKDPIVLKSVYYGNERYFLIVTAWGIEAEDDLVKIS